MPSLGGERNAVQNPFLRYAQESGWVYLSPEDALRLRRGETDPLLSAVTIEQLQRLNPGIVDHLHAEEIIRRFVRVPPTIEGNLQAWEYLKGLKTVFVEVEKRERNIRLLDPTRVEINSFHVTDEFRFTNGTGPTIRADVVLLVNGIPVVVVETKAATHMEGIAEAVDQIRRYHVEAPELMAVTQLHSLTHLIQYYYGGTWNMSRKGLLNWRDEQAGDFETLVKTFLNPRRILRVLTEFILFARKDDELTKAVLRPHQMRAAERVLQRARDGEKRRGLVWHTQGSGKTYTMITVAKLLIEDPTFQNPTVLMLVDRNELEGQLFDNLQAVGFGHPELTESKQHLRELLLQDHRGLIVSMIHKFEGIPANINRRNNIFVLVDEAHRSTGGELGTYLMGALPNATYIGFTGTPIDRTAHGQGTFKVFGTEDARGYLDKYSIRESIADGTTVPLNYALAPNDLQVDREVLERDFLNLAEIEGVSDIEELNRVLDRAVTLKNLLKNADRVRRVAAFVAQHFRENVEPMGYKAFLVAVDREACTLYKQALDTVLPPEYSAVVMSAGFNDPPALARFHITEDEEKRLRKDFRKADKLPKILIVTEKLLTGFDAPILYCMYLDKPMRDHVLLQAMARVNRPYEDEAGRPKPAGFVLDFVGIFDKLEKALAFDSEDVEGVIEGLDVLRQRFETLLASGRTNYLPLWEGLVEDKAAEAVLEHFRDRDRRHDFYRFFRELEELFEIIAPDAFLRPFLEDYNQLARMYQLLRAAYEPGVPVDRSFFRKTAQLVQQSTRTTVLDMPEGETKLDAETLERIANQDRPDAVKVFNLLKALHVLVEDEGAQVPYLMSIGERAEQIAKDFEDRQATTQEALQQLEQLVRDYRQAENGRQQSNLSPEGFAVLWLLSRQNVVDSEQIAGESGTAFQRFPHWKMDSKQESGVRLALYKALTSAKLEQPVEFVDHLLDTLRRASR